MVVLAAAPAALVAALVEPVAALVADIADRIPARSARALGELGVPDVDPSPTATGPAVEQLLGALDDCLQRSFEPDPGLAAALAGTRPGPGAVAVVVRAGEGAVEWARAHLIQLAPGHGPLVSSLLAALCENVEIRAYLQVPSGDPDAVLAGHGRGHVAVAVAVAALALTAAPPPVLGTDPAATIALALDALTVVLPTRPLPEAYRPARLQRDRAEYLLPVNVHGNAHVTGNRLCVLEDGVDPGPAEPANGLVEPVRGGLIIRTGLTEGPVRVWLKVLQGPPEDPQSGSWDEVVECSYPAVEGAAKVLGMSRPVNNMPAKLLHAPPWPGPIRARVYADGRDQALPAAGGPRSESYLIELWAAPQAPERVWKASDQLGHRLRGEPEPVLDRPEAAYGWVQSSLLSMAATVTVVSGSTLAQVLSAFGADPTAPVPLRPLLESFGIEPWVAVLHRDGYVLAVEINGWEGSTEQVLARVCAHGEAASVYWNANADRRQTFARDGSVLAAFEWMSEVPADLAHIYAGFDPTDFRDTTEKFLLGMERFTGFRITRDDIAAIEAADVAYPIAQ